MQDVTVKIGEFLASKIDNIIASKIVKSRDDFIKNAIWHYLEEVKVYRLKSELFNETLKTKEIMQKTWEKPMKVEDALRVLSSLGGEKTKSDVNKSIESTEKKVEAKYANAYKELKEMV
ncbi:MAG: ribbon-helix-helix domain-containing protein [Methanosarcinales archaeon]